MSEKEFLDETDGFNEEELETLLKEDEEIADEALASASNESSFEGSSTSEELQSLMEQEGLIAPEVEEEAREFFIEEEKLKSLLESILFANPKPLTFDAIKQIFKGTNIKSKQLRRVLEEFASDLADSNRGIYLEEVAGGYQLRTKMENAEFLKNAVKQRPFKISGPALETLSIIAYKQPCIKAEVDTIRGVESGHLVRVLMDKGLVAFEGKSDLPGKPMLYKTTKKFLEVFGLRNIRELPSLEEIEQLIPEGIGPTEEKKTLDTLTGELSLDYARRDMEAEEELTKISDQLVNISTTSEYFEKEKERQRDQKEKDRADDIRERLLLGQPVDEKETKWLKRYEEKLLNPEPLVDSVSEAAAEQVLVNATTEVVVADETVISETTIEVALESANQIDPASEPETVEKKLSGLAAAAKDANALFDDVEDEAANKIDV